MRALDLVRRTWDHLFWADRVLLQHLRELDDVPAEALREYAHVLGAEEVWLSRVEGRDRRAPVWPDLPLVQIAVLAADQRDGWEAYLDTLSQDDLTRTVSYATSDGRTFTSSIADILTHVPLHGQYHRGKVNVLLRQAGKTPAPVDFIAFARGAPAAVTPQLR
jgi:uncharacterized damage-inducible protein DinB